jgi:hypothetical protein
VLFQPNIAMGVRAQLERRLAHRVVQLVSNDFVLGRLASEATEGGPGSELALARCFRRHHRHELLPPTAEDPVVSSVW